MGYSTEAQARDAGAVGTTAEVLAAIAAADATIDNFTGDTFAPVAGAVVVDVFPNGVGLLRRRVQSVSAVQDIGGTVTFPAGAYIVTSSETPGEVDAVVFGGSGLSDPLILGAEPWNGGYMGLVSQAAGQRVKVTGSFGWDAPPPAVVSASTILAAEATLADAAAAAGTNLTTDDEGNVLNISLNGTDPATGEPVAPTTGSAVVDAMLAPYVRSRLRLA